jgi:hypothetical protein
MIDMNHEMASQKSNANLVLTGETYVPESCVFLPIAWP